MSNNNSFKLYAGDGTTIDKRNLHLPLFEKFGKLDDPTHYLAEPGLRDAVNVALALGQPLLVTGEPGTGKTQLAASLAHELGLGHPLVFNVKTTSTAKDLFYRYDALRHFHDAQFHKTELTVEPYITYEALGLAIIFSMDSGKADPFLPEAYRGKGPIRSVVLIDEIDKAPRDLPNDVLNEIENMTFTVKETGRSFVADQRLRPILILTSNSEKNLPDAFVRRCAFYHISFPDRERLRQIVQGRLDLDGEFTPAMLENALGHFESIRSLPLRKKPATAELLAWLEVLKTMNVDVENLKPGQAEAVAFSYCILAKSKEDLNMLQKRLAEKPVA